MIHKYMYIVTVFLNTTVYAISVSRIITQIVLENFCYTKHVVSVLIMYYS